MKKNLIAMAVAGSALLGLGMIAAGDDYAVDPAHSGVSFQITHLDLTWIHGRFNEFSGTLTLDPSDPSKSSLSMTINPDSVDTNNAQRDNHLKSGDFFNAKQYPKIEFVSTSMTPTAGGYEVAGNLSFHGETKPVTFTLKGGKTAEFPKGVRRIGYTTQFKVKRSEFGVGAKVPTKMLGDEVYVDVGFEATRK